MSKNDVIRQLVSTLESLKTYRLSSMDAYGRVVDEAIAAGEAELAKPDHEPVMWGSWAWDGMKNVCVPAHKPKDGKERPKLFPLYTTPPEPVIPEGIEILREALREISLAGMSRAVGMSDEETEHWHARRAFEFIGIAARALYAYKYTISSAPDYKGLDKQP